MQDDFIKIKNKITNENEELKIMLLNTKIN